MALYIAGLVLATAAVELLIAYVIATHVGLGSATSTFWLVYFLVVIGLAVAAGILIAKGLSELRAPPPPPEPPAP
jgi:hypothetical protein